LCPNFLLTAGISEDIALKPEAINGTASIDFIKLRREFFILSWLNFFTKIGIKRQSIK
jgi:hypothetical protein